MTKQELSALIDKVVGTKGIMRSSAWWVRRLFNKVLEYVESEDLALKKKLKKELAVPVDKEISDKSDNPVANRIVKEYADTKINYPYRTVDKDYLALSPNVFYAWSGRKWNVVLAEPSNTNIVNEYAIKLTCDYIANIEIVFPSDIKWANGETPAFQGGKVYMISIIDKCGVWAEFDR